MIHVPTATDFFHLYSIAALVAEDFGIALAADVDTIRDGNLFTDNLISLILFIKISEWNDPCESIHKNILAVPNQFSNLFSYIFRICIGSDCLWLSPFLYVYTLVNGQRTCLSISLVISGLAIIFISPSGNQHSSTAFLSPSYT